MELMNFNYNDHEVRTITQDGEPWFVASDICEYFGVTNRTRTLQVVDPQDKGGTRIETPGGEQTVTIINESGLYDVLFSLRPRNARGVSPTEIDERLERVNKFRRWVTHEVLPSIRKHGGYLTPAKVEDFLTDPDTIIQLATNLKEERAARVRAEKAREAISSYAQELEPKADNYDRFISGDGTYSVGTVAKMLGQSQNKLFTLLRNAGVFISKGPMRNTPYQKYMHHFAVKACDFHRSDDTTGTSYTTRVQPSGVDFVARKLGLQVTDVAA